MWVHPDEHRIVGGVLAVARKQRGITQQELARRLGKPQSFVSSFENGQRRIDVLELLLIAAVMGADAHVVFAEIAKAHAEAG